MDSILREVRRSRGRTRFLGNHRIGGRRNSHHHIRGLVVLDLDSNNICLVRSALRLFLVELLPHRKEVQDVPSVFELNSTRQVYQSRVHNHLQEIWYICS